MRQVSRLVRGSVHLKFSTASRQLGRLSSISWLDSASSSSESSLSEPLPEPDPLLASSEEVSTESNFASSPDRLPNTVFNNVGMTKRLRLLDTTFANLLMNDAVEQAAFRVTSTMQRMPLRASRLFLFANPDTEGC
jgi:hypothetical protein